MVVHWDGNIIINIFDDSKKHIRSKEYIEFEKIHRNIGSMETRKQVRIPPSAK